MYELSRLRTILRLFRRFAAYHKRQGINSYVTEGNVPLRSPIEIERLQSDPQIVHKLKFLSHVIYIPSNKTISVSISQTFQGCKSPEGSDSQIGHGRGLKLSHARADKFDLRFSYFKRFWTAIFSYTSGILGIIPGVSQLGQFIMYIGLILSMILLQKNQYYDEIIVQRSNQLQYSVALKIVVANRSV